MVYLPRQALPLVVKDMWDTNRHTLAMTLRIVVDLRSPLGVDCNKDSKKFCVKQLSI